MRLCLLTSILFLAMAGASAQTGPTTPAPTPQGAQPVSAEQMSALSEAVRLSRTVVELYGQKKYDEALPLAERVLSIREQVLGPAHPQVAAALSNLAVIYSAKLKFGRAEESLFAP